ncbi:MAG TPA: DNA glycosylase [Thermotogota bacterium]|nr:DNA glycosylase [Thermotogota bacterium]
MIQRFQLPVWVPLDLDATLGCGQTFRWKKVADRWVGVVNRHPLSLRHDLQNGVLEVEAEQGVFLGKDLEEGVRFYLGLSDPLSTILESTQQFFSRNGFATALDLSGIFSEHKGLRILHQDPFEMLVEFLLSTQTSIPALQGKLEKMCSKFPENRCEFPRGTLYRFPTWEQLSQLPESDFQQLGFGYRSRWLTALLHSVHPRELVSVQALPFGEKLEYLLGFEGIGYKVANCVLLFGFGEFSAFPVDVWISRVLQEHWHIVGNPAELMECGQRLFGPYCGYAQQYLFHHFRNSRKGGKAS